MTEEGATDYTTTINGIEGKTTGEKIANEDVSKNVFVIINNKESNPITGIFMNVMPFAILIILAIIGIYAIRKTSKK